MPCLWTTRVPWQIFTGTGVGLQFKPFLPCPFTLRRDLTHCSATLSMIANYGFVSLNVTAWPVKHGNENLRLPGLYSGLPGHSYSLEIFAHEPSIKFGLITSDGVTSSVDWLPINLLDPLPISVWCLTVMGVLAVSAALIGLQRAKMRNMLCTALPSSSRERS